MAVNLFTPFTSEQGIALWVSGTTYPLGYQVISPANLNVYIRKIAGAGTTDPRDDTTNWKVLTTRPQQYALSFGVITSASFSPLLMTNSTISSTSSGTPTTVLDITGAGVLRGVLVNAATSNGTVNMTVSIDGVDYTTSATYAGTSDWKAVKDCLSRTYDGAAVVYVALPTARIPFYKSLKITGYKSVAGVTGTAYYDYSLEQ